MIILKGARTLSDSKEWIENNVVLRIVPCGTPDGSDADFMKVPASNLKHRNNFHLKSFLDFV